MRWLPNNWLKNIHSWRKLMYPQQNHMWEINLFTKYWYYQSYSNWAKLPDKGHVSDPHTLYRVYLTIFVPTKLFFFCPMGGQLVPTGGQLIPMGGTCPFPVPYPAGAAYDTTPFIIRDESQMKERHLVRAIGRSTLVKKSHSPATLNTRWIAMSKSSCGFWVLGGC